MSARGGRTFWLLLLLVGSPALGDEAAQRKARANYRQGVAHIQAGNYAIAAEALKTAYDLGHAPECLLQLGHAYRLAGNNPAALDAYKRFLEEAPEGAGADEALRWVVALEKGVRESAPPPPPAPEAPPPAPPAPAEGSVYNPFGHSGSQQPYDFGSNSRRASSNRRAAPARPREDREDDEPPPTAAPPAAVAVTPVAVVEAPAGPPPPLLRRPWFWATVSVGAVVVAVGLGVGLGIGLQPSSPTYGVVNVQ